MKYAFLSQLNYLYIQDEPWIKFQTVKTSEKIELPLHLLFQGKGYNLLLKYQNNLKAFFELQSNAKTNKVLGYISNLAGIKKHISFHVARHTAATLLLYEGIPITTIQKLLGHRNISTITNTYLE